MQEAELPRFFPLQEFYALREAGFDRLSIGVQSFSDTLLETLGRIHSSDQALDIFRSAKKAGFRSISIDLMYGIPRQTLKNWLKDLERIEELDPEHVSCYDLSVIEGTQMHKFINDGVLSKPDEETCRDMYFAADETLTRSGYLHYEVSNFARSKNYISRHNSSYWDRTPYIGLGPSAHSFDGKVTRSWNVSSLEQYLERVEDGQSPTLDSEVITKEQAALEMVMLGLRCSAGIDFKEIETETGLRINRDYLNTIISNNRVLLSGTKLVPTAEGMLYADGDSVNLI
jgi:oxygen-independent coproporphyrinogen-3 oxidase